MPDWEFTDHAVEAVRALRTAGYATAIVTNQSGIAAGYYREEDFWTLTDYMQAQLERSGARIDAIAFCPHGSNEGCPCRKPATGMVQVIEKALGQIDYRRSWTVGDKLTDIRFGAALETKTALLRSRYWTPGYLAIMPDIVDDCLYKVAKRILAD